MKIRRHVFAVAACAALFAGQASADDWHPRFDLLTAGAAASVILHHLCAGASSSYGAAEQASIRLQREAMDTGEAMEAQAYAVESYRLKLRAFELSTQGLSCSQLERLVNIAVSQGFSIPASNR